MPAGRPPKPIGTAHGHRKRRSTALANVEKQRRIPRPPAELLPINRKRWRLYWESDLAKAADRAVDLPRLERWIGVLDEYERLNAIFKQTRLGIMYGQARMTAFELNRMLDARPDQLRVVEGWEAAWEEA